MAKTRTEKRGAQRQYDMTECGKALQPALDLLENWGVTMMQHRDAAVPNA